MWNERAALGKSPAKQNVFSTIKKKKKVTSLNLGTKTEKERERERAGARLAVCVCVTGCVLRSSLSSFFFFFFSSSFLSLLPACSHRVRTTAQQIACCFASWASESTVEKPKNERKKKIEKRANIKANKQRFASELKKRGVR